MACNIIKGLDGTNTVVDANGNPSALYDDLLQLLSNYPYATSELIPTDDINNLALQYYELSNTPEFRSKYNLTSKLDVEVSIDDIISHINTEYSFNETQEQGVKEGVEELFESTPELANSVYEALGFGNFDKTYSYENEIVNKFDADVETIINGMRNVSIADDEDSDIDLELKLAEENGIKYLKYSEYFPPADRDVNHYIFYNDKGKSQAEEIYRLKDIKGTTEYQRQLGYLLQYNLDDVSKFTEEPISKINKLVTPEQKQQAQQLYSQYLSNFVSTNFDSIISDLQSKNLLEKKCS
jgi:hypothetical protein